MKIFTLIIGLSLLISSIVAQTATKVHTQSGVVKELMPYSAGLIFISEDDSGDRLVYSMDGLTGYTTSSNLVKGSAKELTAFNDDDLAMIIGDANDGLGIEIHKVSNGVASSIIDHNGEGFEGEPGKILGRFNDGSSNMFFYSFQILTDINGEMVVSGNDLWYTDGENWNTGSISKPDANFSLENVAGMTENQGRIYFGGAIRPSMGFRVDQTIYSLPLNNLWDTPRKEFFYTDETGLTDNIEHLVSNDNDVYCLFDPIYSGYHSLYRNEEISGDAPEGIYRMVPFVTVNRVDVPRDNISAQDGMISIGSKLYAVMSINTTFVQDQTNYEYVVDHEEEKLYSFEGRTATQLTNINGDGVSDEISELTHSGDYIFFFSGLNADMKLHYYNVVSGGSSVLVGNTPYGSNMTAITNGVVFTTGEGASMEVKLSNGGSISSVAMPAEYVGDVSHIMVNNDAVYVTHLNGTDSHVSRFVADVPASIEKDREVSNVHIGPNPVSNYLNINSPSKIVQVDVFNMQGSQVLKEVGDDIDKIDMTGISKGLYLIQIKDIEGTVRSLKVYKS